MKIGDRFAKRAGAGFVGERLPLCFIPDIEDNEEPHSCVLCGDPGCREWPTCYVMDVNGRPFGAVYHVSECEMEPVDQ